MKSKVKGSHQSHTFLIIYNYILPIYLTGMTIKYNRVFLYLASGPVEKRIIRNTKNLCNIHQHYHRKESMLMRKQLFYVIALLLAIIFFIHRMQMEYKIKKEFHRAGYIEKAKRYGNRFGGGTFQS